MPTGFIYVISTLGSDYQQPNGMAVPTWHMDRIYFGPCKRSMRPRMNAGDYVFGLSPTRPHPRRLVFAARIEERMTFARAYRQFPNLRGPEGPIHVRPVDRPLCGFPDSHYEHIPRANHAGQWRADIRVPELDAFFLCEKAGKCNGRWLGQHGPPVKGELLEYLRTCEVWGRAGKLNDTNKSATGAKPVRHGGLYTGLHLETENPRDLMALIVQLYEPPIDADEPPSRRNNVRGDCETRPRKLRRARC